MKIIYTLNIIFYNYLYYIYIHIIYFFSQAYSILLETQPMGGVAPCRHWEALHRQVKITAPVDLGTVTSSKVLTKPCTPRLGATCRPSTNAFRLFSTLGLDLTDDMPCDRSNSTGCCSSSWSWYPQSWPPSWHDWDIQSPCLRSGGRRCLAWMLGVKQRASYPASSARPWGWSSKLQPCLVLDRVGGLLELRYFRSLHSHKFSADEPSSGVDPPSLRDKSTIRRAARVCSSSEVDMSRTRHRRHWTYYVVKTSAILLAKQLFPNHLAIITSLQNQPFPTMKVLNMFWQTKTQNLSPPPIEQENLEETNIPANYYNSLSWIKDLWGRFHC